MRKSMTNSLGIRLPYLIQVYFIYLDFFSIAEYIRFPLIIKGLFLERVALKNRFFIGS